MWLTTSSRIYFKTYAVKERVGSVSRPVHLNSSNIQIYRPYALIYLLIVLLSADFYPTRIFKLDDENFAEDFESFVEDYGLEEVGEEAVEDFVTKMSALVPDGEDQVKPLMAQVLVDFPCITLTNDTC